MQREGRFQQLPPGGHQLQEVTPIFIEAIHGESYLRAIFVALCDHLIHTKEHCLHSTFPLLPSSLDELLKTIQQVEGLVQISAHICII